MHMIFKYKLIINYWIINKLNYLIFLIRIRIYIWTNILGI